MLLSWVKEKTHANISAADLLKFSVIALSELNGERRSKGKPGVIVAGGGVESVNARALDIIIIIVFKLPLISNSDHCIRFYFPNCNFSNVL